MICSQSCRTRNPLIHSRETKSNRAIRGRKERKKDKPLSSLCPASSRVFILLHFNLLLLLFSMASASLTASSCWSMASLRSALPSYPSPRTTPLRSPSPCASFPLKSAPRRTISPKPFSALSLENPFLSIGSGAYASPFAFQ